MGFLAQIRSEPSRLRTTLLVIPCMFSTGLSVALAGPTILDLQQQTRSTLTQISLILTARSAGAGIGSLIMGFIYPKINFLLAVSITMMVTAVFTYLIGIMVNIWLLLVVSMISFGCLGFIEGGLQVFFLHMWGREAMPFIQVAYFILGCGCLSAPLIAEPFLTNRDDDKNVTVLAMSQQETPLNVHYAYAFPSAWMLLCCLLTFIAWWLDPNPSEHPSRQRHHSNHDNNNSIVKDHKFIWKVVVIALHLSFVHLYAGVEISLASFLVTFAVECKLKLSKSKGSYLTSLFWSTFTFMKLAAMLIIPYIGNGNNILLGIAITTIGSTILVPYGSNDETLLWIGVALIGIGMSSIYACTYRYLEGFFPVTSVVGGMTGFFFISGEFTFPFLISAFIEHEPRVLLWVVMCCTIAMIITYPLVMIICNSKLKR